MTEISLAIVGDFDPANHTHRATNAAVEHAMDAFYYPLKSRWIGTEELTPANVDQQLGDCDCVWIAPASPYRSMDGALAAIRFARERRVPLLGTCGGFQHIILEYARNMLGLSDADHAESNPYASRLFISRLACSLVGRTMALRFVPGSLVARAYGTSTAREGYYCNFGINPEYVDFLRSGPLRIVASDDEGEARAVELADHTFFVGTLFLPQLLSVPERPHPLIVTFLRAASPRMMPPQNDTVGSLWALQTALT